MQPNFASDLQCGKGIQHVLMRRDGRYAGILGGAHVCNLLPLLQQACNAWQLRQCSNAQGNAPQHVPLPAIGIIVVFNRLLQSCAPPLHTSQNKTLTLDPGLGTFLGNAGTMCGLVAHCAPPDNTECAQLTRLSLLMTHSTSNCVPLQRP